jgi:hypothetical protein
LTLYDVVDVTGTIIIGGSPVTVNLTTPGQNARLTFSATAGQRVSFTQTAFSSCAHRLKILKPDGSTLIDVCAGSFVDVTVLPTTGTYTLVVDPGGTSTGSTTLTLYDVVDATGSLSINGSAIAVTITTPGQRAFLTFDGTGNQQVTVRITGNTMGSTTIKLNKPDGTQLTSSTSGASNFNLTTQTLPSSGTYTIVVDPSSTNTGSANVSVTSP